MRRYNISRRQFAQTAGAGALLTPPMAAAATLPMRNEASDTPKICLELSAGRPAGAIPAISSADRTTATPIDDSSLRRIKQLGVNYVVGAGPSIPWQAADLRARMDRVKVAA